MLYYTSLGINYFSEVLLMREKYSSVEVEFIDISFDIICASSCPGDATCRANIGCAADTTGGGCLDD